MRPAISIALLLLSATVIRSLEVRIEEEEGFPLKLKHDVRVRANHHTEDAAFPGACRGCVFIVSKVKEKLGSDHSKDKIQQLLDKACNWVKIRFLRIACNKIMTKFKTKLINAIESLDSPRNVCVKLKLCKSRVYR
ncbi:antimicrobial peptide NK-lysin-like [Pagrus major]|uniref:antimicrobial peptide NK-lysin-like n=1 Tax=Pagrus major TaxID=143350 RepID=UPI003CC8BE04